MKSPTQVSLIWLHKKIFKFESSSFKSFRWDGIESIQHKGFHYLTWEILACEGQIYTEKKSVLLDNERLPSFFTMVMTIASLFLNDQLHFSTTIMLVLTSQLCLYTLFQSSLEGIPQTAYMKMIDYWNMLAMTASLTNFFTLFLWEILKFRGIKISRFTLEYNQLKITTRIVIPLITLLGVICYWIMAGALYFETTE